MTTPIPPITPTLQLEAANDNAGGATRIDVPLSAFVTILAQAYVARVRVVERSA